MEINESHKASTYHLLYGKNSIQLELVLILCILAQYDFDQSTSDYTLLKIIKYEEKKITECLNI